MHAHKTPKRSRTELKLLRNRVLDPDREEAMRQARETIDLWRAYDARERRALLRAVE